MTVLDSNVLGKITVDDLIQDADKALNVLVQQPEVDSNDVTLIGHSEGAQVVPRVVFNNPDLVDKIVLMGAAQNHSEIGEFQIVNFPVLYAQQVLDYDHNGSYSTRSIGDSCFSFCSTPQISL